MGKVDRDKFKSDSGSRFRRGGRFSSWKKEGETVGFIHPMFGLWERWTHGTLPSFEEQDDGTYMVRRRAINCMATSSDKVPSSECPTCLLQEFARQKIAEGFDDDEAILDVGKGKDRIVYTLKDLAGEAGYYTDPTARKQVVFAWIPRDKEYEELRDAVEIITGPQTLGSRIIEVIEDEIKERGEVRGDVEVPAGFELGLRKGSLVLISDDEEIKWSPFGLKLKYRKNETAQNKYGASKMDRDLCEVTPKIAQVMVADEEELGIDLERMCEPTSYDRQMEIIGSSWSSRAVPFEDFEDFARLRGKTAGSSRARKPKTASSRNRENTGRSAKDSRGVFCPECGEENRAGAKFCQGCGSKLGGREKPARDSDDKVDDGGQKKTGGEEGKVRCPECNEMVEPMRPSGRCPECGVKLGGLDDDVPF